MVPGGRPSKPLKRTIRVSDGMYRWIKSHAKRGDTMNMALARAVRAAMYNADEAMPKGRRIKVNRRSA